METEQVVSTPTLETVKVKKKDGKDKKQQRNLEQWFTHIWIFALVLPLILNCFPATHVWAAKAFESLKQVPGWYVFGLWTCMAWCFGHNSYKLWSGSQGKSPEHIT